jgi:HKD family nuclease
MRATFLGRPFAPRDQLGGRLVELIDAASAFHAITAWTQLSGLTPIEPALRDLRGRGGTASILVGVDGGIATKESLELARELFDPATVFHDTGNRLFHPKVYVVELPAENVVIVGSSNLTGSGLYANYEANVLVRLDPADEADRPFLDAIDEFRASLATAEMPTQELTAELIEALAEDETLVMSTAKRLQAEAALEARAERVARKIFGTPVGGLPGRPRTRKGTVAPAGRPATAGAPSTAPVALRYWKTLTVSDAMRKPPGSHQRKYVTLTESGHDIDRETWFRDELFGSATWSEQVMRAPRAAAAERKVKEAAEIPFDVWIGDEWLGSYPLRVDHAPNRIAGQGNSPTYLNWSSLGQVIGEADYTGWWLELARLADGAFRLRLLPEEPTEA